MVSIISHIFHPGNWGSATLKKLHLHHLKSHNHRSNQQHQTILLPHQSEQNRGKPTLVLDLDQTLVDSSFHDWNSGHDFFLDVEHENEIIRVYMWKRPGLQQFLKAMSEHYELVLFTAADKVYANMALNVIDPLGLISYRLFKDSCTDGTVKDLSRLGRNLKRVIIVDDNPSSYILNTANGLPIARFLFQNRSHDRELLHLIPYLRDASRQLDDLTVAVKKWRKLPRFHPSPMVQYYRR